MQRTQTVLEVGPNVDPPAFQVAGEDSRKHDSYSLVHAVMNAPSKKKKTVSDKSFPKALHNTCTYWSDIAHELKLGAIDSEESKSRKFGSKTAWCPRGDLLEKWNQELYPQAQGIVSTEVNLRHIYRRSKKQCPFILDLWMICEGSDWENAHPTVVAMCVSGRIAKRSIQVLEGNPQFRDLNLGFGFLAWEEEVTLLAGSRTATSNVEPAQSESLWLCGSRVLIISVPVSATSLWNQATIGGVLLLNGTYYGLSTAHAFYQGTEEQGTDPSRDNGGDSPGDVCEASEDERDWQDYLKELEGLEASNSGEEARNPLATSEEPLATVVYLTQDLGSSDIHRPEMEDSASNKARICLGNSRLVGFLPKGPSINPDDLPESIVSRGSQWISRELDWALIRIHDPLFWEPNFFESTSGMTLSTSFVSYSPPYGAVMIATRHKGPRLTRCWGRKVGLMLPGAIGLQEVWCLDSSCSPGDCGAWVIDPGSGCLHGIVVASSQGLDVTYIIPAHRIFADINQRLGGKLGGPEDMFPNRDSVQWSSAIDEDVLGRCVPYSYLFPSDSAAPSVYGSLSIAEQSQGLSRVSQILERSSFIDSALGSDPDISRERARDSNDPNTIPEDLLQAVASINARNDLLGNEDGQLAPTETLPNSHGHGAKVTISISDQEKKLPTRDIEAMPSSASLSSNLKDQILGTDPELVKNQQDPARRYRAGGNGTRPLSQSRGEQSIHGGNVNYAPYLSGACLVFYNETVQAPMFSLFPRPEVSQLENATPIPRQAYDLQASTHARNAQSRSHDRGSKYYASTHHGAVVVEPAVSRRSDAPAAPSSTGQASTNNTYSGMTRGTGSHLSELGQDFVKLTCGDYGACQEFMDRYPGILDKNQVDFQLEALRLQRDGKTSQFRNCVQQLLLLRKTSKMSGDERRTFFNRMKAKDPKTLKEFILDFDKIHDALKTLARAKQPNPTHAVKNKSEPEFVDSDDRRHSQAAVSFGHPPEATRRQSEDEGMSASLDNLNISIHNQQDPARSYGAGGNGTRPPSVTYRPPNGRRPTLPSVDENSRPNFPNSKAPSVVDYDIRGDDEKQEELDHRYRVRPDGEKFFKVGRVFAMLWHESVGFPKGGHLSNKEQVKPHPYRVGKYGERVYSHIVRMVVVKERHGYCWCIPIHTYNGRGVMKSGFNEQDQKAHAIIYMDDTRPASTSEEEMRLMTKKPIAVCAASSDQRLHVMSRLNFGAPYSIQINVKVMDVGMIAQASMSAFKSYWRNERDGN